MVYSLTSFLALRGAFAIVAVLTALPCCRGAEAPWYLSVENLAEMAGTTADAAEPASRADASGESDMAIPATPAFLPAPPAPRSMPDELVRRTVKPGEPFVPLTNRQKARLQLLSTFEPAALTRIAVTSGLATLRDSPEEWPRTVEAYQWRFADRIGQRLVYKQVQYTLGSVLLKEDPRYFLAEGSGNWAKIKSAFKQTWMSRRDDGRWAPAYGTFAGAFAAGAVSSRWQPERRQEWDSIVRRSSTQIGLQFCNNLLREFLPEIKRKFKR